MATTQEASTRSGYEALPDKQQGRLRKAVRLE